MSLSEKVKESLKKRIDSPDRKKIKKRTRHYPGYDYRIDLRALESKSGDDFSFLALGDTGAGGDAKNAVARDMGREENDNTDFLLHLGDVVYLSGSKQGYKKRFINVYKKWILAGHRNRKNLVFSKPFLPIYGNHDYYDMQKALSIVSRIIGRVFRALGTGSKNGKVFDKVFVEQDDNRIEVHTTAGNSGLPYIPEEATRIPNRYYWFTYKNCAFIALDSNTLDATKDEQPIKIADFEDEFEQLRNEANEARELVKLTKKRSEDPDQDNKSRLEYEHLLAVEESGECEKRMASFLKRVDRKPADHDVAQLDWLKYVLNHDEVRDKLKIIYMHHSMYVSDESHTADHQVFGLRKNLMDIITDSGVSLVLSGHSHCFECVKASDYPDVCFIVSGAGGQNPSKSIFELNDKEKEKKLFLEKAETLAYANEDNGKELYNYLRINVETDKIEVKPVGVFEDSERPTDLGKYLFPVKTFSDLKFRKLDRVVIKKDGWEVELTD